MKTKRKQAWLAALLGWLLLAWPAAAQGTPAELAELQVALWPEYDRPEMLVIYRGVLAAETALPAAVEMRIPASAGGPSAVAFVSEAGERLNQEYTTRPEGEWLVVAFELNVTSFQLEYYDPLAVDAAGRREYTFAYPAGHAVKALSLEVQEPAGAEGFTLQPAAVSRTEQMEGLSYHFVEVGALAQGQTRSWTVAYQKGDTALSLARRTTAAPGTAAPAAAAAEQPGRSNTEQPLLIFAIAFVALAAVGAGAFWLGRRTQAPDRDLGQGQRGAPLSTTLPGPSKAPATDRAGALYCHRCGSEQRPDAEFCHRCGTAVRKP